jgi:hypothetical protein
MRDAAFREYGATTRRELAGLGKKLYEAFERSSSTHELIRSRVMMSWSAARRRSPAPPRADDRDDPRLPPFRAPSIDEARTPFARELGECWVEVEPGIYERDPSTVESAPRAVSG